MSRLRGSGLLQVGALALALSLLAAALYGPHAVHGGFLSDSWSIRAAYVFAPGSGFGDVVDNFLVDLSQAARPLAAVYLAALNVAFGPHMGFWFAWLGAMGVLLSVSVFLLLRKLGLEPLDATPVAILLLIFPATTSLRFWAATAHIQLAIGLAAFGFLLALIAFEAPPGRRRLALHGASLAAFVAGALLYEAAMPLMLSSVLLYRLRVPWRRAARRWALDVVVLVTVAAVVAATSSGAKEVQDLAGMWAHGKVIFEQAWTLLATVVLPLRGDSWYLIALVGLVPLVAALVARRLPEGDPARARLRRLLAALAGGLAVVALGYSVYVPGIDYYGPLGLGIGNRVNAVPAIGWVLALYALIALAATLALRGLRDSRRLAAGVTALACALIAVGWVQSDRRDSDAFTNAYLEGQRALGVVRAALPAPPPGSTIWTFGQPLEIELGVPVFGNTWDMRDSVALMYGDPRIESYVGFPETTFECRAEGVVPGGIESYPPVPPGELGEFGSPYGRTWFVETTTGRVEEIRTPEQCRRAALSFGRSPPLPGVLPPPPAPAPAA